MNGQPIADRYDDLREWLYATSASFKGLDTSGAIVVLDEIARNHEELLATLRLVQQEAAGDSPEIWGQVQRAIDKAEGRA